MDRRVPGAVRCLLGAAIGGVLGYFAFTWILKQGFYAIALPGALVGAGGGWFARGPSWPRGLACGAAGIALGIFAEWSTSPFEKDESFAYFLTHLHHLRGITLIMIGVGGLLAYWFGKGPLTRIA
jgi:hypothetical protein